MQHPAQGVFSADDALEKEANNDVNSSPAYVTNPIPACPSGLSVAWRRSPRPPTHSSCSVRLFQLTLKIPPQVEVPFMFMHNPGGHLLNG